MSDPTQLCTSTVPYMWSATNFVFPQESPDDGLSWPKHDVTEPPSFLFISTVKQDAALQVYVLMPM
jgi:hypothetical protein